MDDPSTCTALVLYTGSDSGTAEESTSLTAVADSSVNGDGARSDGLAPRFVGLSNQGATCYMNSLLQTLYMTPEFRAALYEWKHEAQPSEGVPMGPEGGVSSPGGAGAGPEMGAGGLAVDVEVEEDPSECIPLQLQRLFGQLQLSDRTCVETRALTDSFGWTAQDSFQQHDVQELCRVLFDALESTFQGTVNEKLVNNLYQGSLRDYVTCKECHSESSRLDNFLDVSLVLRPFGGNKTMKSVTESLEYFLKPEVLDGDNQYYCQACDKKVDAVKGLKFERLPYLLSLQLKRFDFDYDTFQRIKLNDEMRFPLVLDMNKYVDNPGIGDDGGDGYGSCTEGYRKHHRSDFQRSVSLEKKKLQGLIGKTPDSEDALHGAGNLSEETGGAGGNVDESSNGTGEDGVIAVGLDGEGASATAVGTAAVGTKDGLGVEDPAAVDLDTDETDKEEGSLDSGASTGAKGGEADLPELEDYWGIPFQDKTGVGDRKPSAFGNIGEPREGVDGAGEKRNGAGKGVAWAKEDTEQDDPLVPEEIAEDAPKLIQENGPWVYELFAVLIHSGSALGGHYYAHIKSLGDDAGWFTFNDSRVTPTDEEAVKRAWGGRWGQSSTWQRRAAAASASSSGAGASQGAGTGGRSSQPSASESAAPKWGNSAANAYMVMYRRVDSLVNKRHLRREEVPKHVVREVTEEDRRAAEAEAAAEAKRAALASSIKVTVKLNGGSEEKTVTGDKRRPLRELVDRAAEAFGVPIMEDEEAVVDAPEGGNGDEERRGLLCQPVEAWVSKDCTSDGGETDRETQDESRSDDSAAGRGGAAGDEEEMRGGGVGAGRGAVSVSGQGPKNLGYLPRVGQGLSEGAIASLKSGSPRGDRRLVRLRDYLPGPRLPGAPLEEASSPAKLFFGSNKTLSLETREPGAPWPRFDRDDINVGVVRFDRAVQEVDKPDEASCRGEVDLQNPSRAGGVSPKLPVRGGFAPERITRMKASGTVREMRTQLATFAGTVAERTRVFTMSSEKPKSTYKVLCPARRLGLGRRLPQTETPTAGGGLGADASARGVGLPLPPEILASEAVASAAIDGATQQAPVIGFTTAKALMDLEAAATPPPITRYSEIDVFSWGADQSPLKKLHEKNEGENGNDSGNGYGDGGDGCDVEDEIVVLGEQGSSFVHNVYVEEVPEEDDDARYGSKGGDGEREGENMSLAVQVALDQLNRISLKLQLTGGLEGPDMINVDKRWTSDQLRNAVAAMIGRDNRSFQLRKTKASAQEIRPGPETLEKLEFYDLLKLHVSPGRPLELYEEAITIAPLEVGFAIGLRAAPPPSVVKALAGGRTANVSLSPWQQPTAAGIGQVERAAPAGSLLGDTPQNDGEDSVGCKLGGCGEECAGGPEIGAETGLSSMTKGCASVVAATVAPFVPDLSSAVGSSGSGGAACSMLDREAGGFAAPSGADGDGYEESAIASALLLTLGAAMTGETGSSDDESATAPLLPTASPDGCVVSHPRALEVGSEAEAADDDTPQASARPDSAACSADATPPLLVTAVWAAAAASAAAASKLATADTERLTTTFVEVAPQENCWREQFIMAVKRDSKVADIRCAVWQEMRRNGLVPNSSCGPREGVGEGEGDRSEPSLGRTPAALRLRDKRAKIPSTILRDSDGKPTRSRYGSQWIPRLLVTQTLPDEEDLGQDRVRALAAGGEDEKREEGRLAATTTCARGFSFSLPPADARVVVVQWWDRWEWRLTEKYEAWISPTETVAAARKRLAEQVGVDPANLRVNRCNSGTRLRLCDLRGPSDTGQSKSSSSGGNGSLGLGVASVESGGWDSTFNRTCRWADFDVSHGNQPVGTPAVLEGDLLLLQDVSQPLKRLAAATEASIIDSGVDRASGDSWSASAAGCDMSSVGSWYAGSESVGNGNGEGGESTATVTIATTTASKSYISFKPKERALRIRTRRDRLQEGKVASMAAAAATAAAVSAVAAGSASTQVAAVESLSSDNRALIGEVGGSASARATGFELGSPGVGAKRTSLLLYSGEKTIATDANGSGGSGGECLGLRDDRDDRGGLTSGDCTDEASGDLCAIGAVAAGGNVCASASDRARGFVRGKIEDAKIEDVSSPNRTEDDDVWGVELSEREAYAGLSVGHGNDDAITMHSDAEVAERGGRSQFDDLALVE